MAIQEDDTIVGQPAIDFEALGVKPVSDEDLYGLASMQEEGQPAQETEIDFEALGVKPVSDLELYGFETQPATEEPRDNSWDTLRGLEVSMRQVPQLAYGVAGLVGETAEQLTGYGESLRDFGFKGYQDWAQSMEPISKETDDVTVAWQRAKEGDVGALVDWAQYGIGYALGQLGETAAVAVLGGIAGGAAAAPAGPAAVPAAAGGAVVAAAGKQGFKSLAKNLVEKAISAQAQNIVKKQAAKEGVELTGEQLAKRAQQEAIKRQAGKEIGSNAAVFANAIGMQLGSIYGSAEEQARAEGRELTGVDLARIWGTGVATGGVEGVVDKFGLDLLKGKLSDKLPAGRLAGAAVAGGVGTLGEAATEAVQTVGERFGAGKDILSDEAINEYINASALGGLGGGAIGGVGGFISGNPKENAAAKAKVSSEANKDIAPASAETVARQADAIIAETVQETPEQRVARLQEEAAAAAGIELEEEGVGAEPTVPVTPPVEPAPEGAVAPIEPAVEPVVAVEPTAAATPTEPVAPTEPAAAEPVPAVAPRPAVDVEALSPNAKRANRILNNAGVDPETAAFVAQQYQDEIADLGGEELRAFVLDKFEENGGVIPAQMRYSEDPEYYQMAFNVGPEEATTLADNGRFQNEQMAQNELQQNKQWRRKDEQITEAQRGVAQAQPEAQGAVVPAGEVPPSPAIEGRRVPIAAAAPTEVAVKPKPPQLPPNPKFAPLPEPQTYAVLREAREERAKAPKDRARGLEPKKIIGRTAREVLRYASRLNQPAVVGPSDKGFTIYDIAALLAEVNSPLLDKEKVESLGSLGSRGRAARFSGAAAIGVPSTRTTSVETLVHEVAHTLTNDAIFKYSQRTKGKSGKAYIDSLKKSIADKNTPEPVVKLFNLYISTLEQLGIMDAYGKAGGLAGTMHPDMSRKRAIKMQKSGKLRTDLGWSELYGLANVDEFVAQTFSSEKFRNLLKTLQAPTENKSVWESFVNAIRYLLNLPNDTMASAVIEASISIAETVPKIEIQRAISLFQDELDGLNDGLELKLYLENNPSQSIGDAKDDFKKRFNRDPHQFAGQHARFFTKEKIEEEIRGLRDRLLEYQQLTPPAAPEVRESRREPTPITQQDREYMDAVERGDMETAQRIVDEAARRGGYQVLPLFHGTEASVINRFRKKLTGIWLAFDKKMATPSSGEYPTTVINAYADLGSNPITLTPEQVKEWQNSGKPKDWIRIFRERNRATAIVIGDYATVVFKPSQVKSADSVTRDNQGNIIPPSQRFQPTEEDIRYNPLGYDITTVVEDIKAGRTDGPLRAVNNVIKQSQELRDRIQREAAGRQEPRARGKAAILDRLSRERAAGRISEETAQALTDFVNRIREDAIGDTALSIRKGGVSNFNFGEALVSFFLNQDQPATGARVGIHEFFHGLSRFLPDAEVEQMRQDYTKNLAEYLKKNPWFLAFVGRYSLTPEQFEEYKFFNPKEAETKLQPVKDRDGNIVKYQIKYDADNYRYIMLDEWIAEKMTDLVRGKQAVPDTFTGKIAKVIRDFLDLIKAKLGKDAYESFYQTITDPKQKLNLYRMSSVAEPFQIYQPQNFNYAEDVLDRIRYTRTERDPIITQAAMDLKEGKIDRDEYQRIVDLRMPLTKFENIPIPASKEDIDRGLGNRTINRKDEATGEVVTIFKRDLSQSPESITEGRIVEARLDIPAYESENVWVVSMHKPRPNLQKGGAGEVIAYSPTAVLRNVEFGVSDPAAINIAAGKPKTSIATMKGSYVPMTAQQAYDLANRGRSEGWVEIGMNPIRHSYFYDKDTQSPVVSAEEVVQVGGMVLAKNPVYGKRDDYRFMALGGEEAGRFPTFETTSPEAATLSNMAASMAKVDAASEGKPNPENKPTYKISEIASVWMDQGGDTRQLQDMVVEYTNLTPANAKKVADAIAKQYDIQQSIATAFLETQTGLSVEALPEGVTLPKEVDPDRPKPVMQRLFDVFMGVRVPPVKIQVNEKTALKQQIRLKAAANRAAKAEQKRTAEEVVEIIKAMELLGPVRPKQVQALAKRAARVIWTSEKSVEAFSEYAAKVVENANYDADLREAKDAQKRAKQLSTQKKVAMSPQREVLEDVSKIPVNKLDDPRMFAEAVNYYLRGFKSVLSPDYVVIPDAEMESYLSGAQSETQRNQRDLDREANERLAKKYGIEPDQVNEMMESIDIIKQIEAQENREALENLLTEKAIETQQGLRGYDTDNLRADQRSIVSSMLKVDPKALDPEERQRFIRITNNIIYNNQTNGAEYFVAVAKGQQSAREAAQDSTMVAKNRAWINLLPRFISERMQRGWALELQSIADTFRNAFGKGAMAKMYDAMGMLDLNLGFTKANNTIDEIQEKIAEFHRNLEKKYKAAARNQDGLLAEGVVGFLIQSVPKKDEVTSINQRRDLIRQDIANRRRSTTEPERGAMADRIETILNQIDGDSVEAILDNMKREFPANHESLIWYKDTLLPQYKDFLKSFDENFNDQANNYENPNYLTIGFTSAGPSLAITPEEQSLFYDQVSLRPKQSAYTIKRVDYSEIPKDRTTGKPKEIEFNLRRNVFNGLSDQINKAYTSSGWQRIASFMKTPEAEIVFGGAANKDFFIERLNRLRLSRMRRGSMGSGGAIEKAVDSLSIISRKLGTGIALGGIYQWIKQPPDQLITAWGSGGRGDLLAKNIAPKTQKLARTLLNKFSIGRRGDASAGYKYINQMEGHQNRLERYFSESKWDQAKEQAGKIADVWMIALKSSDFLAASAAWMTYYEGELNKQDIKIDDWSKEADLIESDPKRRQAAAFAEQMTDIYQGSSDPTSMATFAQSGKTGWENLVKAIFVPFNSFAIQQRMRLYSDARDAISGSKSGVGGLSGTIGGLILFHATKRYVIPAISGAGVGVLYGLMGVDMDEPDEEKQKEEANKNWRQFLADITGNLLVGGTPQIVESKFIDAMNRASYLVSLQLENDSILNEEGEVMSYDQYSKERSPFYRYQSFDNAMSLGMLEIGLGQAEQVALQTKMLATPEEMEMYTPEEQRLLYFSALSEWLYMMRLNDADFARLVGKARRDMMSAAKDREKEIKAIRSGR